MATDQKKTKNQKLQEKLFIKKESAWLDLKPEEQKKIFSFADGYKKFIKNSKTERLCISNMVSLLEENGFKDIRNVKDIKPGDRFYKNFKGKTLLACRVGENIENIRLVGSHVDSPRLDLKPSPLYEDAEMALLQTHYYGGIKKYHWVNQPLELHGIAFTREGKEVPLHIGVEDDEPKFIIPDLLPHLAQEQMKKNGTRVVEGEELNIVFGHIPINDKDIKEKIKLNVLKYLNEKYGLVEEDFNIAELEFVPAVKPMDIGIDGGMVGAYGQDDRVCVYTSLKALIDVQSHPDTIISYFSDKEETGSMGDTGAESFALITFTSEYIRKTGIDFTWEQLLEHTMSISADVTGALDPTYKSVNDPGNVSYVGRGVSIEKYGGRGGKYSTNDARAEYMQYMRRIADENKIPWQTGEQGKIDTGGGGTIAMFLSRYGMDCVDVGPCMLAMHSTCEVTSKADIYSAYRFYMAFFQDGEDV